MGDDLADREEAHQQPYPEHQQNLPLPLVVVSAASGPEQSDNKTVPFAMLLDCLTTRSPGLSGLCIAF